MSIIESLPHPNAIARLREHFASNFTHAHGVYSIDLDDLIEPNPLEKAHLLNWRFIAMDDKNQPVIHDVRTGDTDTDFAYTGFQQGDIAQEIKQAIEKYATDPSLLGHEFAILNLFYPKVRAIWFRGQNGNPDYFVPLEPMFYGFVNKLYSSADFMAIVVAEAQAEMDSHGDSPDPMLG